MKLRKITKALRELSEIERVVLGEEVWTLHGDEVRLVIELRYSDEKVLNVYDSHQWLKAKDWSNTYDGDGFETFPEELPRLRSKLKRLGLNLKK